MTNRTKVLFLFLAMLGAISVRAYAQQKTSEKISPKERWAFETNAMVRFVFGKTGQIFFL